MLQQFKLHRRYLTALLVPINDTKKPHIVLTEIFYWHKRAGSPGFPFSSSITAMIHEKTAMLQQFQLHRRCLTALLVPINDTQSLTLCSQRSSTGNPNEQVEDGSVSNLVSRCATFLHGRLVYSTGPDRQTCVYSAWWPNRHRHCPLSSVNLANDIQWDFVGGLGPSDDMFLILWRGFSVCTVIIIDVSTLGEAGLRICT